MKEPVVLKEPGVLMFQGRIICYDCSGDWIQAFELGSPEVLPMTPELSRAVHEDLARGRRKAAEFRDECLFGGASRPQATSVRSESMPLRRQA